MCHQPSFAEVRTISKWGPGAMYRLLEQLNDMIAEVIGHFKGNRYVQDMTSYILIQLFLQMLRVAQVPASLGKELEGSAETQRRPALKSAEDRKQSRRVRALLLGMLRRRRYDFYIPADGGSLARDGGRDGTTPYRTGDNQEVLNRGRTL